MLFHDEAKMTHGHRFTELLRSIKQKELCFCTHQLSDEHSRKLTTGYWSHLHTPRLQFTQQNMD